MAPASPPPTEEEGAWPWPFQLQFILQTQQCCTNGRRLQHHIYLSLSTNLIQSISYNFYVHLIQILLRYAILEKGS